MTDAFHGTPITPHEVLWALGRRNYCLSFYRDDQIELLIDLAIVLMIDCGAFSAWKRGIVLDAAYWAAYYLFVASVLARRAGVWFVIPDVIDAGTQEQDALLRDCPAELLPFGAPVWHMDEPISRALRLIETHPRICIGSTAEYAVVGSDAWRERQDELWDAIDATFGIVPETHMLRRMQCLLPTFDYPFTSVDSTDMARNHNRMKRLGDRRLWGIKQKADRWDRLNCPTVWVPRAQRQLSMFAA